VEVLLAAATDPALSPGPVAESVAPDPAGIGPLPPPAPPRPSPRRAASPSRDLVEDLIVALLPDPTLIDVLDAVLADDALPHLPHLLRLLPEADLYLQDEVDIALLPTLTRVWCRKGRRGQRHVETPGQNAKQYGFGLVDWRDGWFGWALAPRRSAQPFCEQLHRAVDRSRRRGRKAMVLCDNPGIHTPAGSKRLRTLLAEVGDDLILVYTPRYDPDSNRIEWLWRALRRAVTHCHQRQTLPPLLDDATAWATDLTPEAALAHIGSPVATTAPAPAPPLPRRPAQLPRRYAPTDRSCSPAHAA
jgi:hypothetical protein